VLIDKPEGWTSHDAVAMVRRRLGTRAVGHAGTLDPFATGLLVVLVGRATRLARFIETTAKRYEATVSFGRATDTDDATGESVATGMPEQWPDTLAVDAALDGLTGLIRQRPPAFSAKHVAGERSHRLARRGVVVDLPPVEVMVHALRRVTWQPPELVVEAVVGKGTYLRALARDLGERLGIPAHCSGLRRTTVGPFTVEEAVAPADVDGDSLRSAAAMVRHLPGQVVDPAGVRELGFGRPVARTMADEGPAALLADDGRLVAIGVAVEARWRPVVVLEPLP
jgi:tRNA pseudouridine55 synthase